MARKRKFYIQFQKTARNIANTVPGDNIKKKTKNEISEGTIKTKWDKTSKPEGAANKPSVEEITQKKEEHKRIQEQEQKRSQDQVQQMRSWAFNSPPTSENFSYPPISNQGVPWRIPNLASPPFQVCFVATALLPPPPAQSSFLSLNESLEDESRSLEEDEELNKLVSEILEEDKSTYRDLPARPVYRLWG